jgi:RND family efflux transporter MFP subunit
MYKLINILLLCLLIQGCKDKGDVDIQRPVIEGVTVVEVNPREVDEYYKTSGTVKARTVSDIAARVMGTVTSIDVKEGDKVSKDQVLLTIDDRDMLKKAEAANENYNEMLKMLESARQNKRLMNLTYSRYSGLYEEKAISKHEMDQIETQKNIADIDYGRALSSLNKSKAALEEARINLGFTKIKSPVSGILTQKKVEVGNMAVPGAALLRVEDNSSFRLEVMVDEKLLENLRPGMPVDIYVGALNSDIKGRIAEIVPAVDPGTRSFLVKIDMDNAIELCTGLYAKAFIPRGRKEAILVPEDAVVEKGQLVGVYTGDDKGVVNYRLIRAGTSYNGNTEVLSGLQGGDRVITDGIEKAIDGGIINNN